MRTLFHIGLALAAVFLFTGCFSSIYDVTFHESSEVVIVPADGGEYYFKVEAGAQTKAGKLSGEANNLGLCL